MSERIIALIPAYNEAERVGAVVTKALQHASEVVVVDDGSADDTGNVAQTAGATVLRHEVNRGKGAAIATALNFFRDSGAEYAVFLDADAQHDAAEIPNFVETARATGASMVVGTRLGHVERMPLLRLWTNRITSWIAGKMARQQIPDSQCGFRLVHRKVLPDLNLATTRYETETEMLIQAGRAGHKIASVPIRTIYAGAPSHIRPFRDAWRFFKLIVKYW